MSFQQKKRAMTPKGQMSGNGSGPAIMMMPPHVRATFMPPPPIKHLPPPKRHVLVSDNYVTDDETTDNNTNKKEDVKVGPMGIAKISTAFPKLKRGAGMSGVSSFLHHFERTSPPERKINPTPKSIKADKIKAKMAENEIKLAPLIEAYRKEQKDFSGEFSNGMNCYNTLFVGRLAYEVTERKLLREMEAYGPVKDLKLITDKKTGESKGYAFVEYEREDDMKRAFRAADGMRLEGRAIVVDVERGHTVPNWLPRKFGGGLGGKNCVNMPGRASNPGPNAVGMMMGPAPGMGMGGPPPPGPPMGYGGPPPGPPMYDRGPPMGYNDRGGGYGDRDRGGGYRGPPPPGYGDRDRGGYRDSRGPPPGYNDRGRGGGYGDNRGPPPALAWERGGSGGGRYGDGDRKRRRSRSRSPSDRRRGRY